MTDWRKAADIMQQRGIPAHNWLLYAVKHGLVPLENARYLADTYEQGMHEAHSC